MHAKVRIFWIRQVIQNTLKLTSTSTAPLENLPLWLTLLLLGGAALTPCHSRAANNMATSGILLKRQTLGPYPRTAELENAF